MSASNKKKLRREQDAGRMTERQIQEQKEAKNLKILTTVFVVAVVVCLVIAVTVSVSKLVNRSGVLDRNTIALTIGDTELNSAELSYYYVDAVNSFYQNMYNSYGSSASLYAQLFYGLDFTTALDDQIYNEETGETWADYFIDAAVANAVSTHAVCDAAEKAGFTLTAEDQESLETGFKNMSYYALLYGYEDTESYLKGLYGFGASEETFNEYYTMSYLAYAYQEEYYNSLEYTDEDLREKDNEEPKAFNSYSYAVYTLNASSFYGTDATDEEKAAGLKSAEEAANSLLTATTLEELNKAIKALEINKDKDTAAATEYTDKLYSSVLSSVQEWVCDDARTENNITVIEKTTESTDDDGNKTTTTVGYYVVMFLDRDDNTITLPSVRHILIAFEGGTTDSTTGTKTYSDEEKAAAKLEAEQLLEEWKKGKATELSFSELAKEKTDDSGSKENGGLYEDIYPGQMVTNFNDWVFDESRKAGDTGIVESSYGYHIMYYVSEGDTTYRDYMIENTLRSADSDEWYADLVEAVEYTVGDTKRLNRDLVISG